MLEQLLETLLPDMRVWVRERKPTTSSQARQWAEDYLQARKTCRPAAKTEPPRRIERRVVGDHHQRCHACGEPGHFARDCRKDDKAGGSNPSRTAFGRADKEAMIRCYNCERHGHVAMNCPSNAVVYCGQRREGPSMVWWGRVEGRPVEGIVLDTGCSRTLVRQDLVPRNKRTGEEVSIRCAHGDVVVYQLADVEMEIEGRHV